MGKGDKFDDKLREVERRFEIIAGRHRPPTKSKHRSEPQIGIGINAEGRRVDLPVRALLRHVHGIGTTGAGKSNLAQLLARQLIAGGHGFALLDPHGGKPDGLFRNILGWLAETGLGEALARKGKLHIVDPNDARIVTGFNPLALPDTETSFSVVAHGLLEAVSRVWGEEDLHNKPTILRVLTATFHALSELGLTLAEAELLFDPNDAQGARARTLSLIKDPYALSVLERLHRIGGDRRGAKDFDAEVIGPINRIAVFLSSPAIKRMVGQTDRVLRFSAILDEGHVLLVNLQDGSQITTADADLLGRLVLHQLMFYAKRRKHPERPFITLIDEAHQFLSGDIDRMLTEARGFGLGLALFHQDTGQLEQAGRNIATAVKTKTATKIVLRIEDQDEAERIARSVIALDVEMPVRSLIRPAAVAQKVIELTGKSFSQSRADGIAKGLAKAIGRSQGRGTTESEGLLEGLSSGQVLTPELGWLTVPDVLSQSAGLSSATSMFKGVSATESVTESMAHSIVEHLTSGESVSNAISQTLATVYEDRVAAVHSLETVTYLAAKLLRELETGTYFVRHGALAMRLSIPRVPSPKASAEQIERVLQLVLAHSHAAQCMTEATVSVARRLQDWSTVAPLLDATPSEDFASPEAFADLGLAQRVWQELAKEQAAKPVRPPRGQKPRIVTTDETESNDS